MPFDSLMRRTVMTLLRYMQPRHTITQEACERSCKLFSYKGRKLVRVEDKQILEVHISCSIRQSLHQKKETSATTQVLACTATCSMKLYHWTSAHAPRGKISWGTQLGGKKHHHTIWRCTSGTHRCACFIPM